MNKNMIHSFKRTNEHQIVNMAITNFRDKKLGPRKNYAYIIDVIVVP